MTEVVVPISIGELVDKITILEIKSERVEEPTQLANVKRELAALKAVESSLASCGLANLQPTIRELKVINQQLWVIEDDIRNCERNSDFGSRFVELARSIYRLNDKRSQLKKTINVASGSTYVEEKLHKLT
jgi:uncharacterized protein DUF6165